MNISLCLWSISLYGGFFSSPYSLTGDLRVPIFFSHCSKYLFRAIRLIVLATQLPAVLHAGSPVSCHNLLTACMCSNNRSKPRRSLFRSESINLMVDSVYAEATEAVKSRFSMLRGPILLYGLQPSLQLLVAIQSYSLDFSDV
jgi:hypothetical protein